MRLGKYDPIVQNCIRELVASGEKPTSFLAVATAKQVLMENDPQLLVENGGKIEPRGHGSTFILYKAIFKNPA